MTAAQWFTSIFGGLILIGGIAFSLWVLRRWLRPGNVQRPSGVIVGIVAFLLAWILVVLVILGWQVFKASRRPVGAAQGLLVEAAHAA
jgi:predicted PurR-regulated permease PerM